MTTQEIIFQRSSDGEVSAVREIRATLGKIDVNSNHSRCAEEINRIFDENVQSSCEENNNSINCGIEESYEYM